MSLSKSLLLGSVLALLAFSRAHAADVFPSLAESGSHARYPGKVIWHDLFTAKPAEAVAFYNAVFGWEGEPLTVNKHNITLMRAAGYPVACIVERAKVEGEGAEGVWIGYISVQSVDNTIVELELSGGRVLVGKGILPGRGDHAICVDAQGAVFGLLRTVAGDPADYAAGPGEFVWSQLVTNDTGIASSFYGRIAALEVVPDDRFGANKLFILAAQGYSRAGISPAPADRPYQHANWIQFVRVDDIGAAVGRVEKAGGTVEIAPRPDLLNGRLAIIKDPSGAVLGLLVVEQTNADTMEVAQ